MLRYDFFGMNANALWLGGLFYVLHMGMGGDAGQFFMLYFHEIVLGVLQYVGIDQNKK